jgi:asparagine synthase (glutamine-hydrolysing)
MCGIVGAFGHAGSRHEWIESACSRLHHRGPDGSGVWRATDVGVALGHTRLAILDLSEAGRQPMTSACQRYHLILNGEIYNHLDMRRLLPAQSWRGHSDTETLLACLATWGAERTLRESVGMFAFAAFDSVEPTLILARDRLGEKPLYYGYTSEALVFASELKALRTAEGVDSTIDRVALAGYMRHSYVPSARSIYTSLRKLSPGTWTEIRPTHVVARSLPAPHRYWSAYDAALAGEQAPLDLTDEQAVETLERVLGDAVRGQMLSDVPLGAFLSGGIDSSTIVALMQAHSARPVRTFSIGFEEPEFDESKQARQVSEHLGTDHTELIVRGDDALALVPRLPQVFDEPFADASQLPTLLVAQLARRHVTVALSGDGGDELFAGYNRYFLGARLWPRISRMPRPVRQGIAHCIGAVPSGTWDWLFAAVRPITPGRYQLPMLGDKLLKAADVLGARSEQELYSRLVSQWWREQLVLDAEPPSATSRTHWPSLSSLTHRMMLLDAVTYLPDDILVKVDRAAMAFSLETRVPMLDHRVFELAWRLPLQMKVRGGLGKWILRQLLYRHVPRKLVERPKKGFAVPLDTWLRGSLRDWAENLLADYRLRDEGYLDAGLIRRRWHEHVTGRRNWQYQLWNVLVFEAWLEATRCAN